MYAFVSPAYAQAGGTSGTDFLSFLPLLAVLGILYFFFFRTQQKKDKQHKDLLANLKKGDRVLTTGGLIGTIAKVGNETEVLLEIAEGVRVYCLKNTVVSVLGTGKVPSNEAPDETKAKAPKRAAKPRATSKSKTSQTA